jgi:flavin reductase (DIM6/NTAB) family NADH-FMN oxidoreductase RutF
VIHTKRELLFTTKDCDFLLTLYKAQCITGLCPSDKGDTTNDKDDMTADPIAFRTAMRQWTSGVVIVTSLHEGHQHGMTVSSFTSVSVFPPVVLISLAADTRTNQLVRASGIFAVTILESGQREISDRFAGRLPDGGERLKGVPTFTLATGAALIQGGLAHFDCKVIQTVDMGSTSMFLAEVVAVQFVQDGGRPLTYYNRDYRELLL